MLCSFTSLFLDIDRYHYLNSASQTLVVSLSVAAFRPLLGDGKRRTKSHSQNPGQPSPGQGFTSSHTAFKIYSVMIRESLVST